MSATADPGPIEVELFGGPLDGAKVSVLPLGDGMPPDVRAFPCPGGRGDMVYKRTGSPAPGGRLRYEFTGERAPG